jgi:hypothetical protein
VIETPVKLGGVVVSVVVVGGVPVGVGVGGFTTV